MALFTAIPADVFGASGLENSFCFLMVNNNGFGDLYIIAIYIIAIYIYNSSIYI